MSFEPSVTGVHQDRPLGGRKAKNRLSGLVVDFVSMVKAGDNPDARVMLMKRHPGVDGADSVGKQDNGDDVPDKEDAMQGAPAAVVAYVEALESELLKAEEERDAALEKAKTPPPAADDKDDDDGKDDMEKVLKSVTDPAVRAILKAQGEAVALAKAEAAEAKAAAQIEKDARTRMVLKQRVEGAMGHLGNVDETVDILQKVAKASDTETYTALEKLLTTASQQAELGGLFKELGQPGFNGAAADPLEAEVAKIQKAEPTLTYHQAYDKAMELHPQLYHQAVQVGGDV